MLQFFLVPLILLALLLFLFMLMKKEVQWLELESSIFECGFSSYFFSRFSFSIHYFLVGLIFLFLDLELCFIMPIFLSEVGLEKLMKLMLLFLGILLMSLVEEWFMETLDWKC